ncbi:MAG: hypothetical protein QOG21_66 [Actinomycetota bacterium]|jgi:hypothetical protein|nr:hypothetical protein [Actinomycetota bacterium]
MNEEEREQEEQSRRRPRVVDKRISARPAGENTAQQETPPPAGHTAAPSAGKVIPPVATVAPAAEPEQPQAPAAPGADAARERVWTPEQEAEAARMAQEIAETPSFEWVVNTAVTLANVAATKLELGSGADAQLAIDALAGLLNSVGPRLQQAESPLRQTLAQLQLAYAEGLSAPPPQ